MFLRFWFGFNFISFWTSPVQSFLFWGLLCLLHLCTHCYTPKSVLSSELKSALGDSSVVQWLRLCASTVGGTGLIPGWEVPRVASEGGGPLWRTYGLGACMLSCFSPVQLFATLWTVAHHTPLSMEFSRQEYWSGLPCSPPGDLPNPEVEGVPLFCLLHWQVASWPHTDYFWTILDLTVAQVAPW